MCQQKELIMDAIEQTLPPFFSRDDAVNKYLSGFLTKKSLANIDSEGRGVPIRVRLGKKIVYERVSFMAWLREYSTVVE